MDTWDYEFVDKTQPAKYDETLKLIEHFIEHEHGCVATQTRVFNTYASQALQEADAIFVLRTRKTRGRIIGFLLANGWLHANRPTPTKIHVSLVCGNVPQAGKAIHIYMFREARKKGFKISHLDALQPLATYYPRFGYVRNFPGNGLSGNGASEISMTKNLTSGPNWIEKEEPVPVPVAKERPRRSTLAKIAPQKIRERPAPKNVYHPDEIVWVKFPKEPWWPAQIHSVTGRTLTVTWYGTGQKSTFARGEYPVRRWTDTPQPPAKRTILHEKAINLASKAAAGHVV
jgi:hypothetical protein